ncbi:membrane fusion protein, epimerase transport system [Allopseudospirillum japonicum]|uniref:Membrane fusion protein (MFP) family protein n=1 Tax=Allopseudospirillum japonicum TaxID=64971 RepID=A0A1H6SJC0_9GAMM|nr:HlyD family type I secretion periplasmic adaptor subunit [Allopseudospirillum japonicum]SEI67963.1 membrane fusion protein, epimerase transport system [Allopseudospirillum japonicum]
MSELIESERTKTPGVRPPATEQTPLLDTQIPLPLDDKKYRRLGMMVLLLGFGLFGAWAALAKLSSAIVAPGIVSAESYKKTVQHLEGGIVADLLVKDGDHVNQGDLLVRLDNTQPLAQLDIARSQYRIARAREARLIAEQTESELTFPQELLDLEQDHQAIKEVLAVQRQLFQVRRASLNNELDAMQKRVGQIDEQIRGLQSAIRTNQQRIASLTAEADDFRTLYREGLGDNQRIRELERAILQYQGEIASRESEIARLRIQASESELQVIVRKQAFQQEVAERLREVQTQVADYQERLRALEDTVARTEIRAPVSGAIVGMEIHTLGGVIAPGRPILSIVPRNDDFVIETRVNPADIDSVYLGQEANIRFSAFNQRLTKVIEGEVIHVSADRLVDQATGMPYYQVRVRVTEQGRKDMNENMQLLSGMPAEVMLNTGERTLVRYLAKPLEDTFARALKEE